MRYAFMEATPTIDENCLESRILKDKAETAAEGAG